MLSEIIALPFIAIFLPNVLLYIETMATSREATLNIQESLDLTFTDQDPDEKGIIDEEEEFESISENELFEKLCYLKDICKESRYQCGSYEKKPELCPAPRFMVYHATINYSQK